MLSFRQVVAVKRIRVRINCYWSQDILKPVLQCGKVGILAVGAPQNAIERFVWKALHFTQPKA